MLPAIPKISDLSIPKSLFIVIKKTAHCCDALFLSWLHEFVLYEPCVIFFEKNYVSNRRIFKRNISEKLQCCKISVARRAQFKQVVSVNRCNGTEILERAHKFVVRHIQNGVEPAANFWRIFERLGVNLAVCRHENSLAA